ncbi:hypothetical protein ABZS68_38640 [Streptomyces sp. NPDC005571]|uniref:hypothetical protein n=1 Tax=Streptomyces sp. NPDC005571 TaxID=3156888 RepID=UPI0033A7C26A
MSRGFCDPQKLLKPGETASFGIQKKSDADFHCNAHQIGAEIMYQLGGTLPDGETSGVICVTAHSARMLDSNQNAVRYAEVAGLAKVKNGDLSCRATYEVNKAYPAGERIGELIIHHEIDDEKFQGERKARFT